MVMMICGLVPPPGRGFTRGEGEIEQLYEGVAQAAGGGARVGSVRVGLSWSGQWVEECFEACHFVDG